MEKEKPFFDLRLTIHEYSVSKVLRHHQAAQPPVHNPYPDAPEIFVQDVGAMSGRVHEPVMRDAQGWSQGQVLSGGTELDARLVHTVKGAAAFRRHVREIASLKHICGVASRHLSQLRVGRKRL